MATNFLPSAKWTAGVGLGTGLLSAGALVGGMLLNPGFAALVIGFEILGFSLASLALPFAATVAIAAVCAGVAAFAVGSLAYVAANTLVNGVKAGFSFFGGSFSNNASSANDADPSDLLKGTVKQQPGNDVNTSLKALGGTSLKNKDNGNQLELDNDDEREECESLVQTGTIKTFKEGETPPTNSNDNNDQLMDSNLYPTANNM